MAKIDELSQQEKQTLFEDLKLVFSYARTHSTQIHPTNESEMIHLINLRKQVFDILFNEDTSQSDVNKETTKNEKTKEKK
tara:strand:- start:101 stop:340 length:240 start_codon:yes stop_codon:yes gene_type:complete